MAGFGLPNIGQLTEAFRKAQQIQQDASKLQEELDVMVIEGRSEDDKVRISVSGNQTPLQVEVDPALLAEGKDRVEQAVLQAMQAAHQASVDTMKSRMETLAGDLNMPGLLGEGS